MIPRFIFPLIAFLLAQTAWSRPVTYQQASSVLGQPNFTSFSAPPLDAKTFDQPEAIVIEPVTKKVFVSDYAGSRILRFGSVAAYQTHASAEAVLGQPDFDTEDAPKPPTAASLDGPGGMVFDSQGNLYVADYGNSRVLRWNHPTTINSGAPADVVIGQSGFTSNADPGAGPHSLFSGPWVLAIDGSDNLYVGDYSLNRVLRFADAPMLSGNVISASAVFGQPDFSSFVAGLDPGPGPTLTSGILRDIWGLFVDPAGRLWVGDSLNHRVLRFDNAAAKASAAMPDAVLGQPDFTSSDPARTAAGLSSPYHMVMDGAGTLWVSDHGNSRVVGYKYAGSRPATGTNNAQIILGQPNFTATIPNKTTQRSIYEPFGLAVTPAGGLLVAEDGASRVLHFRNESPILRAALLRQISAAKKSLKKAKKAGKKPVVRKLNRKIRTLRAQLATLN